MNPRLSSHARSSPKSNGSAKSRGISVGAGKGSINEWQWWNYSCDGDELLFKIRNGRASEKVEALTFCDVRRGESTRPEDKAWKSGMSPAAVVLPLPDFRPVDVPFAADNAVWASLTA
jgi:hypothetical protein